MRYETIRRLGRGGMGVVDLARDETGREVALKRLSLHGTPEELEKARARIRREVEVLQRLDHPTIVKLLDVIDDGDDLVLVMDYYPGGNLAQRIGETGPMPPDAVAAMGERLLDGLSSAHRKGVTHRDIKPANILFDAEGNAALADLGAAIHHDATPGLTASEMVVGTPGFMSPEQARGEPATPASDMFSLGATLAYAATGHGPFGTADPRVLMLRAAAGRTERLPRSLPVDLRRALEPMLDRDPDRRPTAAAALGGPEGTRQRTAARARRVTRVVPRGRPGRIAAGAAVAILLAGGAAAVLAGSADGSGQPLTAPPPTTQAATTTTEAPCQDLRYQPCEDGEPGDIAPNTDGRACLAGFYDLDDDDENGCEAEPDGFDDTTVLDDDLQANIVPAGDIDEYQVQVRDNPNLRCDGRITFTLTAPRGAIQRMTLLGQDGAEMGRTTSDDGTEAAITLREPNCLSSDDTTLTVRVEAAPGSTPSGANYTLTRRGNY